jgi:hypothetical protein
MFGNIKKFFRNLNFKKNNRPLIFLICLIIATILWFIKSLEKKYETTVEMPCHYTNIPSKLVYSSPPPSKLNIKLRANGFTLLKHKSGLTFTPVNINVKLFNDKPADKTSITNIFILTDNYIPQLSNQLGSDITILDISPDTIFFHFDKLVERKVKILADFNISCLNQFFVLDSIKFIPSEITVQGPSYLIDTLKQVYTVYQKFNDLNSSVFRSINLKKIDQIEFSAYKVNVEIRVSNISRNN